MHKHEAILQLTDSNISRMVNLFMSSSQILLHDNYTFCFVIPLL